MYRYINYNETPAKSMWRRCFVVDQSTEMFYMARCCSQFGVPLKTFQNKWCLSSLAS